MMFNRTSIAALSAAMMLTLSACSGGAQVNAESSASTSASTESASAEASATPTPSPTPTGPSGSEIELIYASMDVNRNSQEAAEATDKAAHAALEQHFRLWNAWRHGDIEHTSDEELVRYVHKDVLESVKKTVENFMSSLRKLPRTAILSSVMLRQKRYTEASRMTGHAYTIPAWLSPTVKTGVIFAG